jgi:saccharopine dehydrogenase (NAD+, L-lysine forming)
MSGQAILIAGGYGVVGSRIAAKLAPDYPDRVVVAGRSEEQANASAAEVGHGVRGRVLDVTVPSSIAAALEDSRSSSAASINPSGPAPRRDRARAALHGHHTSSDAARARRRVRTDRRRGESVRLTGSARSRACPRHLERDGACGCRHGRRGGHDRNRAAACRRRCDRASLVRLLPPGADDAVRRAREGARPTSARVQRAAPCRLPLAGRIPVGISVPLLRPGAVSAHDRAHTVRSRLALDPPRLARLLAVAVRTGAARVVAGERLRRAIARRRHDRAQRKEARFALRVEVAHKGHSNRATLVGRAQAEATAAGTASLVRSLLEGEISQPGAWMPEQVIDPPRFFSHLDLHGFRIALGESDGNASV